MTNAEMLEKIQSVITALNHVSCEGMQNLLNLGGSIGILNEISQSLVLKIETEKNKD